MVETDRSKSMMKKILVSLDGSRLAEKALPYAKALAETFEAELLLVRILEPMIMADYGPIPTFEVQIVQAEADARVYLDTIQNKYNELGYRVKTKLLRAHLVAETIIDQAREAGVDLIVMSTHGRSGLSRWVYGSVAGKVLQQAPCPVLLVPVRERDS
jgi:nucleotide-binding universal stress UspA family protein